jgi:hypothetical protein
MRRLLNITALLLAFAACAAVQAQDGCPLNDLPSAVRNFGYDATLRLIKDPSCLGAPGKDDAPLVKDFDAGLAKSNAAKDRYAESIDLLKALSQYAADQATVSRRSEDWQAMSRALQHGAARLGEVPKDLSEGEALKIAEQAIPLSWSRVDNRSEGDLVFDGRHVKLLSPTGCTDKTATCLAFEEQEGMIRVVNLAARLRDVTQRTSLLLHVADARLQDARWEAYRAKGQHQYFWEVWINGLFMGDDLCPKDPQTGIQRGFCAVPTSQWIVLHPEAGLRWVRSATQSSELKPAFIVEMLGYYRWDWKSTKSAEMSHRYGGSLVAAYSDNDTGRKWSFGPMLHFGSGYNLAATKASGGEWSLLISINLADRYFGRREEFVNYLKELQKPGLGDLLQR